MRSEGMAGTAVCATRGIELPLAPAAPGPGRRWVPKDQRPPWHPDDCTSPCCGVWRPAPSPDPAPVARDTSDTKPGPLRCQVCGLPVTSEYVATTGQARHGNHRDQNVEKEAAA